MKKNISLLTLYIVGIGFGFSQPSQSVRVGAKLACFEGNLSIELLISSTDSIRVQGGTLVAQDDTSYVVRDIAAGQTVNIFQVTPAQTKELKYLVPEVEPDPLFPPLVSSSNVCAGVSSTQLLAFAAPGQTVDWYDAPVGGKLLASGQLELTVQESGKYYAQTRDPALTCRSASSERSVGEVTFQKTLCPVMSFSKIKLSQEDKLLKAN